MKYTIIITVYNKEQYLKRCLDSVCKQNYKNYLVMVVNDGSTDDSEKIIKKYVKKYKILYYKKENTGVADTRNYAIDRVTTNYFLFVDADDYVSLDLLETIDNYSDYNLLSFGAFQLNKKLECVGTTRKLKYVGSGEQYFINLIKNKSQFTVPWGYVYDTNYFKKHQFKYPKGKILEDYYLTPFIIIECDKIISIDYLGYYYCETDNSIITSENNIHLIKNTYLEFYDIQKQKINNCNCSSQLKAKYIDFLIYILIEYGAKLSVKEQKRYIKIIKKRQILKDFENNTLKQKVKNSIIKVLFMFNLFYPIMKLFKFY